MLKCSEYKANLEIINKFIKFYYLYQIYNKLFEKFKFIFQNNYKFNYFIYINIIYISNILLFYVINKLIKFQIAKQLKNILT